MKSNEDKLSFLADLLQIANFGLNITEVSNDEIMKALETQNKKYLEIIIKLLEEIKELIKIE